MSSGCPIASERRLRLHHFLKVGSDEAPGTRSLGRNHPRVYPVARFGAVGAAMAWLRNWAHALHAAVAPRGVQVGHVAIGAFRPGALSDAIAPLYWELHTHRHAVEKVFLLDVADWLPEQTQTSRLVPATKGLSLR